MTLDDFKKSVANDGSPSADLNGALKALWYDGKGDWERAHDMAQSAGNSEGDWVHAYLHRVEGDISNASYWYHRSGKPRYEGSLKAEWASIVDVLLG